MADPTKYERDYSFSDYQANNPNKPLPAAQVDTELDNVANALDTAVEAIKDIRRSDGALQNGIVTSDALSPGLSEQIAEDAGAAVLADAVAARDAAAAFDGNGLWKDDVAALLADTGLTYTAGQAATVVAGQYVRTRAEGFSYKVAASSATNQHVTTAGGVKLYVSPAFGDFNVLAFGAKADGVADDTLAIQKAVTAAESYCNPAAYASSSPGPGAGRVVFPFGLYILTNHITVTRSVTLSGIGHSEFSIGARLVQNTAARDIVRVEPIAQGCSLGVEYLTFVSNGGGGTGGAHINITKTTATCNSTRIRGCTFGTPQTYAIKIQAGDDTQITGCLFDASALHSIGLGTTTAGDVVSNIRITNNTFFAIAGKALLLFNVDGVIFSENSVYPSTGGQKLGVMIDGYNTTPYQIKNFVAEGNAIKGANCLALLNNLQNFTFSNNAGDNLGAGSGATLPGVAFYGTNIGVVFCGNRLSGNFDAQRFIDDAGGTVSASVFGQNSFTATGGSAQAHRSSATTGTIAQSAFVGFSNISVGEQFYTTGGAINVGTIGSLASATYTTTITGARQGDKIKLTPAGTTWPVPNGIVVSTFVSGANTISIQYTNVTAGSISVTAHDFGILVTR